MNVCDYECVCDCDCDCDCDNGPVPASSSYPIIRFLMTKYLFLILTFIPHDEGVTRRRALSGHIGE